MASRTTVSFWAHGGDEFQMERLGAGGGFAARLGDEMVFLAYPAGRDNPARLLDSLITAAKSLREQIEPTAPKDIAAEIVRLADRYLEDAGERDWENLVQVIEHTCPTCGSETDENRECANCNEVAYRAQEDEAADRALSLVRDEGREVRA